MISVIIPTRDCERALVSTLAALVAGATAEVVKQVIVADGGSADETAAVADVAGCDILVSDETLAARLRSGAAAARAPWLMFLWPGVVPAPGWTAEVQSFIDAAPVSERGPNRAAAFRDAPSGDSFAREALSLVAALLGRRRKHGLVIHAADYARLGGHRDTAEPEAELYRRIGRRGLTVLRTHAAPMSRERGEAIVKRHTAH